MDLKRLSRPIEYAIANAIRDVVDVPGVDREALFAVVERIEARLEEAGVAVRAGWRWQAKGVVDLSNKSKFAAVKARASVKGAEA